MGKHDIRNILLGGGILAALYFLLGGKIPEWPPANGGNGGNGNGGNGEPPPYTPPPPPTGESWEFLEYYRGWNVYWNPLNGLDKWGDPYISYATLQSAEYAALGAHTTYGPGTWHLYRSQIDQWLNDHLLG